MDFLEVTVYNFMNMLINIIMLLWTGEIFLKKVSMKGKKQRIRRVVLIVLYAFLIALLGTVCYKTGIFWWANKEIYGAILIMYLNQVLYMVFLWLLYRERMAACWEIALFFGIIAYFTEEVSFSFGPRTFYHMNVFSERLEYMFYQTVVNRILFVVLMFSLYKAGIGKMYRQWDDRREVWKCGVFVLSFYPVFINGMERLFLDGVKRGYTRGLFPCIILLMFLVLFCYMGYGKQQEHELELHKISLQQQNAYIETLEGIQQEVRRFRHDYKNMMAGMYIQAKEGDLEAVQEFIQDITEDFDHQVGDQIQKFTQLGNIYMTQVKGLLLHKMEQMGREGILCEIEVLRPFCQTSMKAADLCRCLGILIDNAAEEVYGKENASIRIMISSQEGYTTFLVKNRLYSQVDFPKIWQQGYSTKGPDRGIGLASYQDILKRYDNVLPLTMIQDGYFIQELKIQE